MDLGSPIHRNPHLGGRHRRRVDQVPEIEVLDHTLPQGQLAKLLTVVNNYSSWSIGTDINVDIKSERKTVFILMLFLQYDVGRLS